MDNLNWTSILQDIELGQAVLLIGHGFQAEAQGQLHPTLQATLKERLLYFYAQDGLFLFQDSLAKTDARREVASIFNNHATDDSFLKKIAEMPFPLMVSTNPDKSLCELFTRFRLRLQFDYLSSNPSKAVDYAVERPAADKPLLYNLCGSIEDQESLILDYDDLFKLFKTLLADLKIPEYQVRIPLKKATTFIFLGFHFEQWYTQLFLRYLNQHDDQFQKNSSNYALSTTFRDDAMQQFFVQQFNVKYIGADWSFFEELHRRFSEKYPHKMRKLVEELSATATTVVQLIEKADYAAAFQMMRIFGAQLGEDDRNLLTMTEANHADYLKNKADGTVSQENLGIEVARVRKNLIQLAKKLN